MRKCAMRKSGGLNKHANSISGKLKSYIALSPGGTEYFCFSKSTLVLEKQKYPGYSWRQGTM